MKENKQVLEALIEKPSNYSIDVVDNSMLPKEIKQKKVICFVIKPPTMEVLAKCAIPLMEIPKEILDKKEIDFQEAIKYRIQMAQMISILAHGKTSEVPNWYPEFILKNITAKELFQFFQEASFKLQSDFFLHSFQIAKEGNPMIMMEKRN